MTKQTITLDGANMILSAALAHARDPGLQEAIAIYDEGGILKALVSMDGARITSVNFALDKAWTAALRRKIWQIRSPAHRWSICRAS